MVCEGLRVIRPNDVNLRDYNGHPISRVTICIGQDSGNDDGPPHQLLCPKTKDPGSGITPMCWRYKAKDMKYYDPKPLPGDKPP